MSTSPTFARSERPLWRRVGDHILIADVDGAEVERLSVAASVAWRLLEEPRSLGELTQLLASRFSSEPTDVADHVADIVGTLERRGWIVEGADRG